MAQLSEMFGAAARLGVANLGHCPDLVAQIDETRLDRVNASPNVAAVVHAGPLFSKSISENAISLALVNLAPGGRSAMRPGGASAAQRFSTDDIKVFSQDGEARWVGRGVR